MRVAAVIAQGPTKFRRSEALNIATSIVDNGTFADAYGKGVGPTAHCAPLYPLLLAGVIRLFGSGVAGYFALAILSSASASLALALLPRLSLICGFGALPGVLAGLAGAALPVNFWGVITNTFDSPFTGLAFVVLCCIMCRIWLSESFSLRWDLAFGFAAAICCLLNAVVLPVLALWFALGCWRFRAQAGTFLRHSSVAAMMILAALAPIAIRNRIELGRTIWTRSNLGLELQVSNNDYVGPELETNLSNRFWLASHPFTSAVEREKVKRLGEPAYGDQKLAQAVAWIESHPRRFLVLSAERVLIFWFPVMHRWPQTAIEGLMTLTGFTGLIALFRDRNSLAWVFAASLAGYSAIYTVVEAGPRYRYPIEALLLLLAGVLVAKAVLVLAPEARSASSTATFAAGAD